MDTITFYEPNSFDEEAGRFVFAGAVFCFADQETCDYSPRLFRWAIAGFLTETEINLSYESPGGPLSSRVPQRPEGFRRVDYLDTFWGTVMQPLDLAAAQPLQCAYPASAPNPGDYLTIDAPVPIPTPGHAHYILTTVTYQGERRAGRRRSSGQLYGRDATRLPPCSIE
jgi:hypothetical protein